VAGLESGVGQPLPDLWQLVDRGTEHVDTLTAGDLGVQIEVAGHLANQDESFGGDFATRHARHHRVGSVLLHVGHEVIVGVLEGRVLTLEYVPVPEARQDRSNDRSADVATATGAMFGDDFTECRQSRDVG
jgi:hypothetical protein